MKLLRFQQKLIKTLISKKGGRERENMWKNSLISTTGKSLNWDQQDVE